jgi:DNA adenine methylase
LSISLIQYVGGKGTHLSTLLPLIPRTHTYVEPYGGAASVLLNRRPSTIEVYNDLNDNLVNLFRVIRDPAQFEQLDRMLDATLYSRSEFELAISVTVKGTDDPVLRAWATYVVHNQGISGKLHTSNGNWSRSRDQRLNTVRWWKKWERLVQIRDRFEHVQVESRDALKVIETWDAPDVTFYLDPPYVLETRANRSYYAFEQPEEHHQELVDLLLEVKGCVVLSGYEHPVYDRLADGGWVKTAYSQAAVMRVAQKDGDKPDRIEVVWRNPQCVEHGAQMPLFG